MLATMSTSYNPDPASTRARWAENGRGGTHERWVRSSGDGEKAYREERGGRGFPPEAYRGPEGGRGAGARDAATRGRRGKGRGGECGYHLPGASQRRAFEARTRLGGRRFYHLQRPSSCEPSCVRHALAVFISP